MSPPPPLHQPDARFGPLPDWLAAAVEPVLRDLQQPAPIPIRLGWEAARTLLWISEVGEESRTGFNPQLLRGVELRVALADWWQEQFFPETRAAWGQARPECPDHAHPAVAQEMVGEAWWICPQDERLIAEIGRWMA